MAAELIGNRGHHLEQIKIPIFYYIVTKKQKCIYSLVGESSEVPFTWFIATYA